MERRFSEMELELHFLVRDWRLRDGGRRFVRGLLQFQKLRFRWCFIFLRAPPTGHANG
jgi:hypothetical protein